MATRTLTVGRDEGGRLLADWLRARLAMSRAAVMELLQTRKVRVAGSLCSNPDWRLRAGQRVVVQTRDREREGKPAAKRDGPAPVIRFLDDDLIVVDKPSGLTTMRHADEAAEFGGRRKRFLPKTLQDL